MDLTATILGTGLLVGLAISLAAALRIARVPGAAIVGGVLAGVLLGPTLLGRIAPTVHEDAFVGGVAERRELAAMEREFEAWRIALTESDRRAVAAGAPASRADGAETDRERRESAIRAARAAERHAVHDHQRPVRLLSIGLAVIVLGSAAFSARRRSGLRGSRPIPWTGRSSGAILVAIWCALACGGATIGVAALVGMAPFGAAAIAATACTVVGAASVAGAGIRAEDLRRTERIERGGVDFVRLVSRTATAIALLLVVVAATTALRVAAVDAELALTAIASVAAISVCMTIASFRRQRGPSSPRVLRLVGWVVVPAVAALVTVRLELLLDARLWPLLLLPLITGDGRWLGATIGATLLGNRRPLAAGRLLLLLTAAGPMQMSMVAIGLWTGLLPATLALGLVAGAVVVEVAGPMRRIADSAFSALSAEDS